ncbi:MAG: hypothetical protein ACR2N3_13785 [Pyrinomonadaceae bacterium]
MKKDADEDEPVSPAQEKLILETFSYIHKIISRKLGSRHRDFVKDLEQRAFLKLWRWKMAHGENDLSGKEWQKMANVVAHNEATEFFREKYTRDILFSQMDEQTAEEVLAVESTDILAGNSLPEIRSLLALVWIAAQTLTLRQKYAYFLQYPDFIVEFIVVGCCSIEELAAYFNATEEKLSEIIDSLPLRDEKIGRLLEEILGEKLSPKQIWEARAKAKAKLASRLKDFIYNERLFVQSRD